MAYTRTSKKALKKQKCSFIVKHGTSEEMRNSLTDIIKQNTHVNTCATKKTNNRSYILKRKNVYVLSTMVLASTRVLRQHSSHMVSKKAQKWYRLTHYRRTFAFLKPKYLKITRTITHICFSQSTRTLKSLE